MAHESHGSPAQLNDHHRDTVARIVHHPTSGNVEWHSVISLLEAIGDVERRHDGKWKASVSAGTIVLTRPRGKDVTTEQVADLRRLLVGAGFGPTDHQRRED